MDQSGMEKLDKIHLLISMAENYLHPVPIEHQKWGEGNITLYEGQFGKVFGGKCDYLTVVMKATITQYMRVSSATADREFFGHIKDEREYQQMKDNLTYESEGMPSDPGPYWQTSYQWNVDKSQLVNNLPAVKGVMEATKKKLKRNPE